MSHFIKSIIHKIKKIRLNSFDILLFVVLIIILTVFLYLRLSKKTEWISVRIIVANDEWWWEGQPPQYWYVDGLVSGQAAYNSVGEKVAEIANVDSFDVGDYHRRAYIDVKLKGSFDTNRKVYMYNFQPLQIGKPIDLTFGKHNIKGLVSFIDSANISYFDKKIEVELKAVKPWVANSYKIGLVTKDSQNRTLAEITNVLITPAKSFEYSDIRGQMIEVTRPDLNDVLLSVSIKTFKSGETYYFVDRAAIKIGEEIWFQFPNTVVRSAFITKIFE